MDKNTINGDTPESLALQAIKLLQAVATNDVPHNLADIEKYLAGLHWCCRCEEPAEYSFPQPQPTHGHFPPETPRWYCHAHIAQVRQEIMAPFQTKYKPH